MLSGRGRGFGRTDHSDFDGNNWNIDVYVCLALSWNASDLMFLFLQPMKRMVTIKMVVLIFPLRHKSRLKEMLVYNVSIFCFSQCREEEEEAEEVRV